MDGKEMSTSFLSKCCEENGEDQVTKECICQDNDVLEIKKETVGLEKKSEHRVSVEEVWQNMIDEEKDLHHRPATVRKRRGKRDKSNKINRSML
mmetsp:Transcript_7868/g.11232  ORF Transcript_7868/g.11232 Transcript_7868/m.11232 type:complete len:94 (+) Transcript_7868:96-377(+)